MSKLPGLAGCEASAEVGQRPLPTTMILRVTAPPRVTRESSAVQHERNGVDWLLSVRRTLPLAEAVHRALISLAAQGQEIDCPELTGQSLNGQPLGGGHRHAHVLPVDIDSDGKIDHVVIYVPMGLGQLAELAAARLKTLFGSRGVPCLHLRPVVSSTLDRWLLATPHPAPPLSVTPIGDQLSTLHPGNERHKPVEGSRQWISLTPFIPPRYMKKSGKNSLVGQVHAELESRYLPSADVTLVQSTRGHEFVVARHPDHAQPPQRIGFSLQLKFATPVTGPLCLGYASHFGLGLFRSVAQSAAGSKSTRR